MGVKLNVTDEDKTQLANLNIEAQVLSNLLAERKARMDKKAREILETNSLSTSIYAMIFSVADDKWEAVLKPGAISVPQNGIRPGKIIRN